MHRSFRKKLIWSASLAMRKETMVRHRILKLIWVSVVLFTISVCALSQTTLPLQGKVTYVNHLFPVASDAMSSVQAKTRDAHGGAIFVFQTDEFWLNLHHFLYVLGRAGFVTQSDFLYGGRSGTTCVAGARSLRRKVWRVAAWVGPYEGGPFRSLETLSRWTWHSRRGICRIN